jgi:hypothetical protein
MEILVELLLQISRCVAKPLLCVLDPLEAVDAFSVALLQLTKTRCQESAYQGAGMMMCVGCRPVHHASRRYAQYRELVSLAEETNTFLRMNPLAYPAFVKFVHDFLGYAHDEEQAAKEYRGGEGEFIVGGGDSGNGSGCGTPGDGDSRARGSGSGSGSGSGVSGGDSGSGGGSSRGRGGQQVKQVKAQEKESLVAPRTPGGTPVRKVPRRASLQYASTEGIQAEQSTPLALVYKGAFLVGERVYVIKDGSQAGKVALVTNTNWNGLIKVAMEATKQEKSYRRDELARVSNDTGGRGSAVPHEVLDYLWQLGRGNPLFTKELLTYLLEERCV